jgi:hypothetical protein
MKSDVDGDHCPYCCKQLSGVASLDVVPCDGFAGDFIATAYILWVHAVVMIPAVVGVPAVAVVPTNVNIPSTGVVV